MATTATCKDCNNTVIATGFARIKPHDLHLETFALSGSILETTGRHHFKNKGMVKGSLQHNEMTLLVDSRVVATFTVNHGSSAVGVKLLDEELKKEMENELFTLRQEKYKRNRKED